jgi:disulfide oxidoreductase YuzD
MSYKTRQTKIAIAAAIVIIVVGITGVYLIPAQSTVVIVPTTQTDQERYDALGIAQKYVVTSPTFTFDGDINSLKTEYVGSTKSIPSEHIFKATFDSSHGGFGNREGQMLIQVITPHAMEILVSEGKVISAITDKTWDEQKELFIQRLTDLDDSNQVFEFDYVSLIDAFEKNGIDVNAVEILEDSSFFVPTIVVKVNDEMIHVYEFSSGIEAQNTSELISQDGTEIGLSIIRWIDEPHFYS